MCSDELLFGHAWGAAVLGWCPKGGTKGLCSFISDVPRSATVLKSNFSHSLTSPCEEVEEHKSQRIPLRAVLHWVSTLTCSYFRIMNIFVNLAWESLSLLCFPGHFETFHFANSALKATFGRCLAIYTVEKASEIFRKFSFKVKLWMPRDLEAPVNSSLIISVPQQTQTHFCLRRINDTFQKVSLILMSFTYG